MILRVTITSVSKCFQKQKLLKNYYYTIAMVIKTFSDYYIFYQQIYLKCNNILNYEYG